MSITRTDEYERIIDNSPIADSFARRINAYPNPYSQKKMSVQEYVDTMINRAGMKDYIQMVNSELDSSNKKQAQTQPNITSVLDIAEIKEAIDSAIDRRTFTSQTPLLAELQTLVKTDARVPEELKDVMGDKKLKEYLNSKLGNENQEKTQYNLLGQEATDQTKSPTKENAFNFDSQDKQ